MERVLTRKDTRGNVRGVTAVAYHPTRKEVMAGFEDGAVKAWDFDNDKPTYSNPNAHQGWVTGFLFWTEWKVLFSASLDCSVLSWSSTLVPYHRVESPAPIHCLMWCARRNELLAGTSVGICVFPQSGHVHLNGTPLLAASSTVVPGHTDIVKCLKSDDSRVYSAGYDSRLIFYDVCLSNMSTGRKAMPLKKYRMFDHAHDAGITCMALAKSTDSGSWLATGSFDQRVKIWSTDGKVMCVIACVASVTGLCYVPDSRVLWVAAGTVVPVLYEPKTGDNISEFTRILHEPQTHSSSTLAVQLLQYESEVKQVLGSTNQKEICVWKYSTTNAICTQVCSSHAEALTYTRKVPILIFTGHMDGTVLKWERLQLNPFLYSHDQFHYRDKLAEAFEEERKELMATCPLVGSDPQQERVEQLHQKNVKEALEPDSRSFTKGLFVESEDLLVMASQDGRIFVWGFDTEAMKVLQAMQHFDWDGSSSTATSRNSFTTRTAVEGNKYQKLFQEGVMEAREEKDGEEEGKGDGREQGRPATEDERQRIAQEGSVTNRVAGFTCLHALCKHTRAVTGMVLMEGEQGPLLLSSGWDLLVCVWSLTSGALLKLQDVTDVVCEEGEVDVLDAVITDMDMDQESGQFACSLSMCDILVWSIDRCSLQMTFKGRMTGHKREATQVSWSHVKKQWVSGSDDETIRLWCPKKMVQEELVQAGGPVSVLMVDKTNGCIIAAVRNNINIYDPTLQLMQVNHGHTDVIRSIIHIPELNQYVSAGWDCTLKMWHSFYHKVPAVAGDDKEGSSDVLQAEGSTPGTSTPRPGPKALLFPRDTAEELAPARAEE